jgi:Putative auto-transporter adhesin, head GIN domain
MMKRILFIGMLVATATFSGCFYYGPCLNGSGPVISEVREIGDFTGVTNTGSFDVFITNADEYSVEIIAQENLIPIIETYVSGYTLIVKTQNDACFKSSSAVEIHVSMPETELLRLSGSGRVFADLLESTEVEISNSGSGYMEIDSVMADSYVVSNAGSGYLSVEGSYVSEMDAIQSGSGGILCGILYGAAEINIRHSSSGRVEATMVDGTVMDVVLSGSGRVLLEGEVELAEYSLNSSGRIDALDLLASDVEATNTGSGKIYLWASDLLDATITGSGDIIYRGNPQLSARITGSGSLRAY